ncbi:hypothetical protein D3C77_630140 [compost metagenome]
MACSGLYPIINELPKKMPNYQYLLLMEGSEEDVSLAITKYELKVPVIRMDHFMELRTPVVPFGYFVSNSGEVISKGIVNNDGHIKTLISQAEKQIPA